MIVSFEHRFVFVAIPKTATHAIREALRPQLGRYDWEQCALFENKAFPVAELARIRHGHLSCRQVKPYLLPGMWSGLVKFCVVRNPYDRFISFSYFWNRDNDRMQVDPLGTMKQSLQAAECTPGHGFLPQSVYVSDASGELMVDQLIRYEDLQAGFDRVCGLVGLQPVPLGRVNASRRRPFRDSYDSELEAMVRAFYAVDFALLGYPDELLPEPEPEPEADLKSAP